MQNRQQGFTLIELVVVIVILGLLAATALPKFIDVTKDARIASMQGVAGGLRGAAALARSQYLVNGNTSATIITLPDGSTTVDVLDEVNNRGFGGRPESTNTGIGRMMPDPAEYTVDYANSPGTTDALRYYPKGITTGSNCYVSYTPNNLEPVSVVTTDC